MDDKKKLACPVCGFETLKLVNGQKQFELIAEKDMPKDWNPDTYEKCKRCKSQIAVKRL